jgi:hypothetical protein
MRRVFRNVPHACIARELHAHAERFETFAECAIGVQQHFAARCARPHEQQQNSAPPGSPL